MAFDNRSLCGSTLDTALTSAQFSASVDDAASFPDFVDDRRTQLKLGRIHDGGVTQADPEIVLINGDIAGNISLHRRGMFSSAIPASWPIGAVLEMTNIGQVMNAQGAMYNGYPLMHSGWITSAATNPLGSRLKFHGGANPEASDELAIGDLIDNDWDIGNFINLLAAGDMVRLKYIWNGDNIGATGADQTTIQENPTFRVEFLIDVGGPSDQTGWWIIPIDTANFWIHNDLPNTDDGWAGFVIVDFVKLV
jgi:hypothetical protein